MWCARPGIRVHEDNVGLFLEYVYLFYGQENPPLHSIGSVYNGPQAAFNRICANLYTAQEDKCALALAIHLVFGCFIS